MNKIDAHSCFNYFKRSRKLTIWCNVSAKPLSPDVGPRRRGAAHLHRRPRTPWRTRIGAFGWRTPCTATGSARCRRIHRTTAARRRGRAGEGTGRTSAARRRTAAWSTPRRPCSCSSSYRTRSPRGRGGGPPLGRSTGPDRPSAGRPSSLHRRRRERDIEMRDTRSMLREWPLGLWGHEVMILSTRGSFPCVTSTSHSTSSALLCSTWNILTIWVLVLFMLRFSFLVFYIVCHCFMLYCLKLCVACYCCCLGQDTLVKEIFNLNEAFPG